MKLLQRLSLLTLLSLAVTGCVFIDGEYVDRDDWADWQDEQRENREAISKLEMGMQRSVVENRLGTPAYSEAYDREGKEVRVLFYRTQRKHSDGETSRDETTPVVFENDVLVGWGDTVYAEIGG